MLTSIEVAAALGELYPDVAGYPEFLRRVLVVEALGVGVTAEHMTQHFAEHGGVTGSHIVVDKIGNRAGVVVFDSASSCSAAANAEPAPLFARVVKTTELSRRNRRRCFRHLENLVGVLSDAYPGVVENPHFLARSLVIDGVAGMTSPRDLLNSFDSLGEAAVLVRDAEFRDRVALVVLRTDDAHTVEAAAAAAAALEAHFCNWTPARVAGLTRLDVLDALDRHARLQPTANLLRSLIPLEYIHADSQMDLHLHCLFLRISDAGGAYGLYHVATEELFDVRPARAIILRRPENVGVLVVDVALATETAGTRASRLPAQRLGLYDSSLFPLPSASDRCGKKRRLLPPFMTDGVVDYTGRVVVLRGLDTESRDAVEVARFLEVVLKLDVDAVLVHASLKIVQVAVQTPEDAQLLLQVPAETWFRAFAQAVECTVWAMPPVPPAAMDDDPVRRAPTALRSVVDVFIARLYDCEENEWRGLVRGLCGLAAIACPEALQRGFFSDRAVVVTGMARRPTSEWDLRSVLSLYGALDVLVLYRKREVGLAIFTSWTSASRLLRDPGRVTVLGIVCRPAPEAGFVDYIGDRILIDEMLLDTT